ncbi:MAG: zinc ribbon domain-containing protein, partial [Bacteroidales bacterium]|nr:zinc ribbon domain-containing protein [Bacteroidales bacterium]
FYLLSGFIFCDNCGHRFTTATNQNKNYYYKHRTSDGNKHCTYRRMVPARELESIVLLQLISTLGNRSKIERAIKRATPDHVKVEKLQAEQVSLEAMLKGTAKKLNNVVEAVADGTFSKEQVKRTMEELNKENEIFSNRLKIVNTELSCSPSEDQKKILTDWSVKMTKNIARNPQQIFKMSFEEKRELIEFAFKGIGSQGNPLGIYISTTLENQLQYEIKANFESVLHSATLTDAEIEETFQIDPQYQDTRKEIDKIRTELLNSVSSCKLEHH